jgi:hypothetical protein
MAGRFSGAHQWRIQVIYLAIATLAITAHHAVVATVNRDQPQLASFTPDLHPSTPGRARFKRSPTPPEPNGGGAWATMCRQPSGTDTWCNETATACWLQSLLPWPKDTARTLPHGSVRGGNNHTPAPATFTGSRIGRSTGTNQPLTELVDFPTLTNRTLAGAHAPAVLLSYTDRERGPNRPPLLAVQLKPDRVHTRVLPLWHSRMPSTIHQRTPQQNARTLSSLLLLKEKSPGSTNQTLPKHRS